MYTGTTESSAAAWARSGSRLTTGRTTDAIAMSPFRSGVRCSFSREYTHTPNSPPGAQVRATRSTARRVSWVGSFAVPPHEPVRLSSRLPAQSLEVCSSWLTRVLRP